KTVYNNVLKAHLCPSETSSPGGRGATTNGGANNWAVGNYAANSYAFGYPRGTTAQARHETPQRFADLTDGTSNIVALAERFGTCGSSGLANDSRTQANLWSDSNSIWRPIFCTNNTSKALAALPASGQYPACEKFQVMPRWINTCLPSRTQSA